LITAPNKFCGKCGARVEGSIDAFCLNCGTAYGSIASKLLAGSEETEKANSPVATERAKLSSRWRLLVKHALIGCGVMFLLMLSVIIPLVHFVSVPLSPFAGGFIAGTKGEATRDQALGIGSLMGLYSVGLVFVIGVLLDLTLGIGLTLVVVTSIVAAIYITGMACLGAIIGGNKARQQAAETASSLHSPLP